ncbi:hypothetical protein BJY59DRAFT_689646 [Rhodotorula toruloides]
MQIPKLLEVTFASAFALSLSTCLPAMLLAGAGAIHGSQRVEGDVKRGKLRASVRGWRNLLRSGLVHNEGHLHRMAGRLFSVRR